MMASYIGLFVLGFYVGRVYQALDALPITASYWIYSLTIIRERPEVRYGIRTL